MNPMLRNLYPDPDGLQLRENLPILVNVQDPWLTFLGTKAALFQKWNDKAVRNCYIDHLEKEQDIFSPKPIPLDKLHSKSLCITLMFFSRDSTYKPVPPGWSRRALTYWDCSQFGLKDSPTIGWVVTGNVDVSKCSSALNEAVQRRAPWLRGRLARTESQSPPYEIHVPPEDSDVGAFSVSTREVQAELDSVVFYTPNGSSEPSISVLEGYVPTTLNPRNASGGVEDYIKNDLPLMHLHFIKASDATLVSLSWSHLPMDAAGCAQVVAAWEEQLIGVKTDTVYEDTDPEKIFDFTKDVHLEPGYHVPGWIKPSKLDYVRVMPSYIFSAYTDPPVDGTIYIPNALVEKWREQSKKELPEGEWVSRNDLVEAWIYKHGFSHNPPSQPNTMFCAMLFRGRHHSLPRTIITNTAMSYVVPTHTSSELQSTSLAQLAHKIRTVTKPFSDPNYVAEIVAYEWRNIKASNGKSPYLPLGVPKGEHFGSISWAKLELGSLKFGEGTETISCLTYNAGRRCATILDCDSGDWRIDLQLSRKVWDILKQQMEKEKKLLFEN